MTKVPQPFQAPIDVTTRKGKFGFFFFFSFLGKQNLTFTSEIHFN